MAINTHNRIIKSMSIFFNINKTKAIRIMYIWYYHIQKMSIDCFIEKVLFPYDNIFQSGKKCKNNYKINIQYKGRSWTWSYGSWIYNYLCNQYLSLLMLWDRISIRVKCTNEVYSIQHYVIKFVSDLRQVGGFLRVLLFPPPIKLTATI
jgi:hypothetical protein